MGRQRNVSHMKEEERYPQDEISEIETSNLLDTEFRKMVIRIPKELNENYNSMKKNIETIKKNSQK